MPAKSFRLLCGSAPKAAARLSCAVGSNVEVMLSKHAREPRSNAQWQLRRAPWLAENEASWADGLCADSHNAKEKRPRGGGAAASVMASGERIAVRMSGRFSFLIDEGLGQLCQGLVGLLLFGESCV